MGSVHNDTLTGNLLDNDIRGSAGDDVLSGMAGNDRLFGGDGLDVMSGGLGADTFVFENDEQSAVGGAETIVDFEIGVDLIDLSAFAVTSQNLTFVTSGGSTLVKIDHDDDGIPDILINLLGVSTPIGLGSIVFE